MDQPAEFDRLAAPNRQKLLDWIAANFAPARSIPWATSYSLKHWFEDEAGIYVTNGAFKGAMLAAGYAPVDPCMLNWRFRCRWLPLCQERTARGRPCRRRRLPGAPRCSVHHDCR